MTPMACVKGEVCSGASSGLLVGGRRDSVRTSLSPHANFVDPMTAASTIGDLGDILNSIACL